MLGWRWHLRIASTIWLIVVCVGLVGVGARWWLRAGERSIGQLTTPVVLLVSLAALVAVLGTYAAAWRTSRSRVRQELERELAESALQVVDPPETGVPVRVRRWSGRRPMRLEVRWGRQWSAEAPAAQRRLEARLAEVVPGEWKGTYRSRRRRAILAWRELTAAEIAREAAAARVEALARKAVVGCRSVRVTGWVDPSGSEERGQLAGGDAGLVEKAAPAATSGPMEGMDGMSPAAIEVTYEPTPRVASERYRAAIEQIMSTTLPGRWRADWDAENDRVAFSLRPGLPERVLISANPLGREGFVPYGVNEDGQVHGWDMDRQPHVLAVGPTGGGKTSAIRTIALNALRLPEGAEIVGADPKLIELMGLVGYPGVIRVATEPEECADLLDDVSTEMWRRYQIVRADPRAKKNLKRLVVILDEFFIMRLRLNRMWVQNKPKGATGSTHPAIMSVPELAALARSCRIHLIVGIQRPDAEFLDGAARDNFRHRISLTRLSPDGARMMWGDGSTAGTDLPTIPGRAIASGPSGDPVEVQVYWTPDPDRRLAEELDAEEQGLLEQLHPGSIEPGTALPECVTVAEQILGQALEAAAVEYVEDAVEEDLGDDATPAAANPGEDNAAPPGGPVTLAKPAAEPLAAPESEISSAKVKGTLALRASSDDEIHVSETLVWAHARAEELTSGDVIDQDGQWVEVSNVSEDPDDEDLVYVEWSTGSASLPAEEALKRLVGDRETALN